MICGLVIVIEKAVNAYNMQKVHTISTGYSLQSNEIRSVRSLVNHLKGVPCLEDVP